MYKRQSEKAQTLNAYHVRCEQWEVASGAQLPRCFRGHKLRCSPETRNEAPCGLDPWKRIRVQDYLAIYNCLLQWSVHTIADEFERTGEQARRFVQTAADAFLADAIQVSKQGFIVVRFVEGASVGVVLRLKFRTILGSTRASQKSGGAKSSYKRTGRSAATQLASNMVYTSRQILLCLSGHSPHSFRSTLLSEHCAWAPGWG